MTRQLNLFGQYDLINDPPDFLNSHIQSKLKKHEKQEKKTKAIKKAANPR